VQLSDVVRYLTEMGVPDLSRAERGELPRVLRAAAIENELHRRRLDRLSVLVGLSTVANVVIGAAVLIHH